MLNINPTNDEMLHGFDVLGQNIVILRHSWDILLECAKDHNIELLSASIGVYIDALLRLDYIEEEMGKYNKTLDSFEKLLELFIELRNSLFNIALQEYSRIFGINVSNRLEEYEDFGIFEPHP